jgi:NADPH:quinone reductase-like Zn-dependent oxidoreductase
MNFIPQNRTTERRFQRGGSADVLKAEGLPLPLPKAGQVLLEVSAASVNPVDYKTRSDRVSTRVKQDR